MHADDGGWHLYYNMASLLWKGVSLEFEMGSDQFGLMLGALLVISHALFVPVTYLATTAGLGQIWGELDSFTDCCVGFSTVLFGLKIIMNHSTVGDRAVGYWGMSFPVQAKYAAWAELVLISLISPNASFMGHLCGILAGLIWLHSGLLRDYGIGQAAGVAAAAARQAVHSAAGGRSHHAGRDWGSGTTGAGFAGGGGAGSYSAAAAAARAGAAHSTSGTNTVHARHNTQTGRIVEELD